MIEISIPKKLISVFSGEAQYRGAYGGRGSGKSFTFAKMLVLRGAERKRRMLCGRELQNSIKDSVHSELARAIESEPFLSDLYEIGENFIRGRNGTEFIFKGLRHNYNSIKSISGIDICWIEEAETVSEQSWRTLIPTIRTPSSEIWLTWNPERDDSPTRERFIVNAPPNSKIAECNWRDNPWFPAELEAVRQHDLKRDPDYYEHIWEGACITRSDALVLRGRYEIKQFEPAADWHGPYYGADWGFSVDPTCFVRVWVNGRTLYVEYEAYGNQVEIDNLPKLFDQIPDAKKYVCYGDSARPETINYMRRYGYPYMQSCDKWPGSLEDGVEHLRSYENIIIHPRCQHTAREARLWSYKIDKLTGNVKPDLQPGNDHCWDAIRYGLGPMIKRRNNAQKMQINHVGR